MIQAGTADRTTEFGPEARAPFAELPAPAYLLAIEGAGHFTFSDMCSIMEIVGIQLEEFDDGCSEENIPYADAHHIINRFATAFLKVYVAGDSSYPYGEHLSADTELPDTATLEVK
jgi:predicted dienelactone hydrolase